ncbi:hypothetical protein M9H77_29291 [Catharanthus roseus]|uniref:Uncharacterized protein n=1 Tax=Catharanthus roseus TaxID=4058 RepID=A0ACC0AKI7_CATRO|nr:hypothetical protein M9H77_29291 [Catharanthus roseus]
MVSFVLNKTTTFNVMDSEATGDGKTDDSHAFLKAWKAVCQSQVSHPVLVIPAQRTFLLKPLTFKGPCESSGIFVQIFGNIVAPDRQSAWKGYHINSWIVFENINQLTVNGSGQIDGQGSAWWMHPCLPDQSHGQKCKGPTAMIFRRCNGLRLNGLTHKNSPGSHIIVTASNDVVISNLHIVAPENSRNTDGIDIASSSKVKISDCQIHTGDDCIAIEGGSSNINITNVICGPGHGISIGALGHGGYDTVEEVHVKNCTLTGTTNGVRIKSWQGGKGFAKKISFEQIKFVSVDNPITINQFYCPNRQKCPNKTSAIALSDISYSKIVGTSITDQVINLSCSETFGCTGIAFDDVYLTSKTPGNKVYAKCINAQGKFSHTLPTVTCLQI